MSVRLLKNVSLETAKIELSRIMHEGYTSIAVRRLTEESIYNRKDTIGAVFDFVRNTFPYAEDPISAELFIHPNRVAEDYFSGRIRAGDCDDHALLTASMLGSIGYKTRILLVGKGFDVDHALAEVLTSTGWVSVDTTSSQPLGWFHKYSQEVVVN